MNKTSIILRVGKSYYRDLKRLNWFQVLIIKLLRKKIFEIFDGDCMDNEVTIRKRKNLWEPEKYD